MKVLLVEDDPILSQMYLDEFKKSGIDVITATEGKKGVMDAAWKKPDFILMDIMMSGMDGVTAYRHLKELPQTKNVPVAFLTVVPEGVPESLNSDPKMFEGAVGYWSKDRYTPMEIVNMVRDYIDKHPQKTH